jgi:hypothetical protein
MPRSRIGSRRFLGLVVLSALTASGCAGVSAVTLGPSVVVLREPEGFHARQRMELHEDVHRRQYRSRGVAGMLTRYLFSPGGRLEMEAEAYAVEACYLQRIGAGGEERWREQVALTLRSYFPLRRISSHRAAAAFDHAYQEGAACASLLPAARTAWMGSAYPHP